MKVDVYPSDDLQAFYSSESDCSALPLIIIADLFGNRSLLQRVQKRSCISIGFVIGDWWISIRFVCFCVSRFIAFELQSSSVFTF